MTEVLLPLTSLFFAALLAFPLLRKFGPKAFAFLAIAPAIGAVVYAAALQALIRGEVLVFTTTWIPQFNIDFGFRIDLLSGLMALLVTGAGALILLYCAWYFDSDDTGLGRFGFAFLVFAASMLGLVIADDVYLMFIFWELTTITSFLLVGHYGYRRSARSAALQALIITTFGGLAMFVGLVILNSLTGTSSLHELLLQPPTGTAATVAVYLLLAGAVTKSAIFPFHFWLPGAMAAPTPVSAYLHAAAMVKAGIYLLIRLTPAFGDVPLYSEVLVCAGAITMVLGALRSLRQYDLKLILAFGTVSQLGMLTMLLGVAHPTVTAAATLLLFAHALAKAPLFLSVGIIEHRTGTRDLRKVNGLAKTMPALTVVVALATMSMIGFPPLLGFVAKEAALSELYADPRSGTTVLALIAMIIGSALTAAYTLRFFIGAFGDTRGQPVKRAEGQYHPLLMLAPVVFVTLALISGVFSHKLTTVYQSVTPGGVAAAPLALWHGLTPAFWTTVGILVTGAALVWLAGVGRSRLLDIDERYSAGHAYYVVMRSFDVFAVRVTTLFQRGSLPFYLIMIFMVLIGLLGATVFSNEFAAVRVEAFTQPSQIVVAAVMVIGAIATLFAKTRFQALIFVGLTGLAMVGMFALHGAPDLAITQALVETMTLVAFVLVIRRLPKDIEDSGRLRTRIGRIAFGSAVGVMMGVLVIIAMGARGVDPVSVFMPELAYEGGHGSNVVNVTLVDIRGWDTFGELAVVVAAATGIASLVFLSTRIDNLPKIKRRDAQSEVKRYLARVADPNDPAERETWLLAGKYLDPSNRSIILEVIVRLIFHALIIISVYILLVGHNAPGGGFAAGLIAGIALVARYLAGGSAELGATVPFDAGRIVGAGMVIAALTALSPMFFGQDALTSSWVDVDLGPFGEISLITSAAFDIGVYFVVFGLILDVLRSLGSQIDVHAQEESKAAEEVTSP